MDVLAKTIQVLSGYIYTGGSENIGCKERLQRGGALSILPVTSRPAPAIAIGMNIKKLNQ